jgi:hypothetical protein
MRENVWKKTCGIYHWRDLCDGGKEDPHETLTTKHVTGLREPQTRGMAVVAPVSKGGA